MQKTESPAHWLRGRQATHRASLRRVAVLNLLLGWCIIGIAFLVAWVLDQAIFRHQGLDVLLRPLAALHLLVGLRAVLAWRLEREAFELGLDARQRLRRQLDARLAAAGPMALAGRDGAELSTRMIEGVDALQDYFARYLPHQSQMTLVPLSILIVVLPLDWLSALILLVTAPLIPLFMILIGKGTERVNRRQWQRLLRLGSHFLDLLRGLVTLKAHGLSRREVQALERLAEDYRSATLSVLRIAFLSSLVLEFLATVSIALVAVLIGFRLLWGEMDYLRGLFILLLAPEFYLPLRTMGTHYHARLQALAAAETLQELERLPPRLARSGGERPSIEAPPALCCEQLQYRYPGREAAALDGVSLELRPRTLNALIGPSGAGKSTLASLLLGFDLPQAGRILVNGQDLATIDPAAWRDHCAWMPQRPLILTASVRENIAPGEAAPDEARLHLALERAGLSERVRRLPQGLDTVVGAGGLGLSGGESRRLALARLFYRQPRFVVLDEPTASLDAETEACISAAIEDLAREATVLVIAHRLHTLRRADHVVHLRNGRVTGQGTHRALLEQDPHYAALFDREVPAHA